MTQYMDRHAEDSFTPTMSIDKEYITNIPFMIVSRSLALGI